MKLKKIAAGLMTGILLISSMTGFMKLETVSAASFKDLSQSEIVADMGAGWNLGNQLEANLNGTPSETAWGNPVISENLIRAVKNAGFSTIRIPVSYLSKIGSAPSYTIDSAWLDRVQQVVDMCINNGLYVIINMHGDGYNTVSGGWLLCNGSDQETIRAKYKACWQQIASKFKNYDEHLIFESMNEEFDGTYGNPNRTYYSNINKLNQIFVDTVRKTGGNNAKRWLIIPGWNTNIEYTVGNYGFEMPSDSFCTAGKRIMISVHYYDPWDFCGAENNSYTQWGSAATDNSKVAPYGDENYMKQQLKNLYDKFTSQGYPVVIGEYGAVDKSNADSVNTKSRCEWAEKFCSYAKEYGCVPVWWDNGYNGNYGFALFNRNTCRVTQQSIIDSILRGIGAQTDDGNDNNSGNDSNAGNDNNNGGNADVGAGDNMAVCILLVACAFATALLTRRKITN